MKSTDSSFVLFQFNLFSEGNLMKRRMIQIRDDLKKGNWLQPKKNLLVRFHRNRLVGV